MTLETNETHNPKLRSWVDSANDALTDFPIQNLPFGVYRDQSETDPRIGVAIGDAVLDVKGAVEAHLLDSIGPEGCCALSATTLNPFLAQGQRTWAAARRGISDLLCADIATLRDDNALRRRLLLAQDKVELLKPVSIGDYTDFYASIHHATNVGSMFRPDNPLLPNYRHLPVGYHGRASSIVVSDTAVRRPMGQTIAADGADPTFGPCKLLDYEMEMGFFVGPGNLMGTRIPIAAAREHIFGMVIVNDWSARDIQKWEYQPLGPFNAKNFATTISPWVVTLDALAPFRRSGPPRGEDDPQMLAYLRPADDMAIDITVEVWLASAKMREAGSAPVQLSRGNFQDMYWTIAQMLVHHTSTGCNLQSGDLLATGTISGTTEESRGSLLERTWRGTQPFQLPDGTERKFLQDGDEIIMKAYCEGDGARRIGFGECRGIVLPAE